MSALTDAEREALQEAAFCVDSDVLLTTVERIVAEREAAAKVKALREAADDLAVAYSQSFDGQAYPAPAWLHDRANRIEAGQ